MTGRISKLSLGMVLLTREATRQTIKSYQSWLIDLEILKDKASLVIVEIFFTDNMVTEYAYHQGNSPNKLLFELIVRLYKLFMYYCGMIMHVI